MISAALKSAGVAALRPLSLLSFFLIQALKIVPVPVIFGRVVGAEIPALAAVGGLGGGAIAGPVATMRTCCASRDEP
jgi:hypothetical protein